MNSFPPVKVLVTEFILEAGDYQPLGDITV